MFKIYVAMMVLGVAMGPGYGVYCHYLSGDTMETATLFELTESSASSTTNAKTADPFTAETLVFNFTPAMNPIALNLTTQLYQVKPSTLQRNVDFKGTLTEGERLIWEDDHRLTWKHNKKKGADLQLSEFAKQVVGSELGERTKTVHSQLQVFEVDRPGKYQLTLTQAGEKDGEIATAHITPRKNVTLLNDWIFFAGFALLVVGFFASIYSHKQNKKST
ncbi:MAG: hypothetical protein AB8C02_16860 [Halioglobus sp.]